MATACEIAGTDLPKKNDSISLSLPLKVITRTKNYTNIYIGNFTKEPFVRQSSWQTGN